MSTHLLNIPRRNVRIHADQEQGPFEWWRNTIGDGGICHLPLPERVIQGAKKLQPRLIRVFIQEFFFVYPDHGVFDWSRLDPYMDALYRTGARVVASICIKPRVLFPEVDQSKWRPDNADEWQNVIAEMVKRYSVEKPVVTHWEIGNETDIGEWGGCPYLITEPDDYFEYYKMTIKPILEVFPDAKVGGPAIAICDHKLMKGFIDLCGNNGTRLDFLSWHMYHDDLTRHKAFADLVRGYLKDYPGKKPELMVTELNKFFDPVSVEELAFDSRRAALCAAIFLAQLDAGLDWTFYYHVWDRTCYTNDFARFFEDVYIMIKHWNEVPHRFGMFGVNQEVRPQYFVYQMMGRLGDQRVAASSNDADLMVRGIRGEGKVSALIINYNEQSSSDLIVSVDFTGLVPGRKMLKSYRIDNDHRWSSENLELLPAEQREIVTRETFNCQVYSPGDSVLFLMLEDII
jgi:xylan 1,4-beta-xylosidase